MVSDNPEAFSSVYSSDRMEPWEGRSLSLSHDNEVVEDNYQSG